MEYYDDLTKNVLLVYSTLTIRALQVFNWNGKRNIPTPYNISSTMQAYFSSALLDTLK